MCMHTSLAYNNNYLQHVHATLLQHVHATLLQHVHTTRIIWEPTLSAFINTVLQLHCDHKLGLKKTYPDILKGQCVGIVYPCEAL